MSYEKFKEKNRVSSLSKDEIFNAGYKAGFSESGNLSEANSLLKAVADELSAIYRCGHDDAEVAKKMLGKIYKYNPRLITCEYTKKYVNK